MESGEEVEEGKKKKICGAAIIADSVKEEELIIWQKRTNTPCFVAVIINLLSSSHG